MIVDCYTTLGPSLANHDEQLLRPLADTTRPEGLLTIMDRLQIDRAVVFAPRWIGAGIADNGYVQANRAVADAVAANPQRLIGYARINPNFGDEAVAEAVRAFEEHGFHGLMLDSEWDNFDPRDKKFVYPVVDVARQHRAPVLVECSWSPVSPASYWRLAADFPETPIILSHLGFRLQDDSTTLVNRLANVYVETSDHMYFLGRIAAEIGAERILFGSNTPFSVPEAELLKVTLRTDLSDDDKALILGGNAARLHSLT